ASTAAASDYAVAVGRRGAWWGVLVAAVVWAPAVHAAPGGWLPHTEGATWTYSWRDSEYSPTPTKEKVTVSSAKGNTFTLGWSTEGLNNPSDTAASTGSVSFEE